MRSAAAAGVQQVADEPGRTTLQTPGRSRPRSRGSSQTMERVAAGGRPARLSPQRGRPIPRPTTPNCATSANMRTSRPSLTQASSRRLRRTGARPRSAAQMGMGFGAVRDGSGLKMTPLCQGSPARAGIDPLGGSVRELCRRIVAAWRGSIQETGDTIAVCGSTAPSRRPASACSAPSIGVPRGHDVLAFMTLPRYGTIGFGKVRPGLSDRSDRAIARPSWQPRSPSRSAPRRLPRPGR